MYISILTRLSREPRHEDNRQPGLHCGWMEAKQNMWHDYATEITGNPVGLPRDLSPPDCNHTYAHNDHCYCGHLEQSCSVCTSMTQSLLACVGSIRARFSESANQIVYGVRCIPGSTFVDMAACSFAVMSN